MSHGEYAAGSVWFYAPNKGAPIFFAVAFAVSGIWHTWQAIRYKSWRLTGLFVFCAFVFVAGFIFREIGAFHYGDIVISIVSICLCFAAPPLYELANYYILGRILYYVPYHSPIHPGRVLTTFAALSMIVEALNGTGAAYMANRSLTVDKQDLGKTLLRAALIIQLVVIALFLSLATYFWIKCRRNGINNSKLNQALLTLYMSNSLILVRCIFRTVEFFDFATVNWAAPDFEPSMLSPIIRYEAFFYVFEASLMLINTTLLNIRHPRRWLPQSTKVYLAKDGISEITGPGYKQDRNFFVTLVDPFDIYGMVSGRDKTTRFWEDEGVDDRKNERDVGQSV